MHQLYTIGHSNHDIATFVKLLKMYNINVICDVRSVPYSKYTPQFNYQQIREHLKMEGIQYVFLGKALGPRSEDPNCYVDGKVQYNALAQANIFKEGLTRVKKGITAYLVALMCAEKDPITCHRTILVCRHLREKSLQIFHILEDGSIEDNRDAERRLMKMLKIPEQTLFDKPEDLVEQAYDEQGERIAYKVESENQSDMDEANK